MKTLQIGNISFEYHPETHGTSLGGTLFFIVNGKPFTWLPQSELGRLGEFITACSQQRDTNLENSLPLVDEEEYDWSRDKYNWKERSAKDLGSHEFCPSCGSSDIYMDTCFACGTKEVSKIQLVDEEDEDTDEFDYDGWYPEHVLEIDDLEFDDRIPFDGYTPAIEDEDTSAEALLNNEIACPHCDGEYIITQSDNMTIATCSQCGYKELAEDNPDNTSPAAIGLEPAA